jgi:hypothetical protein
MWELNYLPKLFEIISLFQTINDLFHPMKHFLAMVIKPYVLWFMVLNQEKCKEIIFIP